MLDDDGYTSDDSMMVDDRYIVWTSRTILHNDATSPADDATDADNGVEIPDLPSQLNGPSDMDPDALTIVSPVVDSTKKMRFLN